MIKTKKQIHEDFLKNCAKMNGRDYSSSPDGVNSQASRAVLLARLQKVKQDFAQIETHGNNNLSGQLDNGDKLLMRLKDISRTIKQVNDYISSNQMRFTARKNHL